jgi:hypothetical protein
MFPVIDGLSGGINLYSLPAADGSLLTLTAPGGTQLISRAMIISSLQACADRAGCTWLCPRQLSLVHTTGGDNAEGRAIVA